MSDILSISNNLLATIYSSSSGTGAAPSTDPLGDLARAEANSTKDIAQTEAQPQVARDIATFRAAVASAKDPATLLQNSTVLKVLLTANGLGDQASYTALAQKALLSNTSDSSSLADQLPNTAWKTAASTLDFANSGLSVIQNTSVLDTIASGYAEVLWRQSLDATTPGLSNALTFRSDASTITSVDQILGDPTLRSVVLTALGIPPQIAYQDIGAEEQAVSSRLDITQFQDPKFVEQFAQRYLIQNNIANSDSSTNVATTGLAAYGYSSPSDSTASSNDTLASLVVQSQGLIV
jgi:hypothetical protein